MSDSDPRTAREEWGNRFSFLVAMLSTMVGVSNIWRMSFTADENDGGAFLVAYILLLYLVAVPGLIAETITGRYTNYGVVGVFREILGSKRAQGLGLVVLIVNVALMSYYTPIIGWALCYAGHSVLMTSTQPGSQPQAFWEGFINNPAFIVGIHTVTVVGLAGVLVFGIRRGIERIMKWMIPLLVVTLMAVSIRGITLPGSMEDVVFAFTPDWGHLTRGDTWVAVLSQTLFLTGLGWGVMLAYGGYPSRYDDVPLGGDLFTAIGNTSIGLLMVFAMFPVVFAFGLEPSAGPNLLFISMAQVFPKLSGGNLWAIVFFVSFFFTTFTSGLGITRVTVTTISEETRLSQTSAVLASCSVIWLFNLSNACSSAFLGRVDFMFGNFGLPLTTLSIIILVTWKFGPERVRVLDLNRNAGVYIGSWWNPVMKYVIPVVMVFIFGYDVYSNAGTVNQQLTLLGVAFMATLVITSTLVMGIIGDESPSGPAAIPEGND